MNADTITDIETDLVAAAILEPRITDTLHLTGAEFYRPNLGASWEAIRAIHVSGRTPDPSLIVEEAARRGVRVEHAALITMIGRGTPVNADYYAEKIRDQHRRRQLRQHCIRTMQALDEDMETDRVVSELGQAVSTTTEAETDCEQLETLDEFVDAELPPEEWILPNLIAKGDRTIVTGEEGYGKSVLIRMLAVCAAAGLDPFTYQKFQPKRVLVIDAENPRRIMQRRMQELRDGMRLRGLSTDTRLWIQRYPQGFDLTSTKNRLTLHNICQTVNPDLLVIGPIYKLYEDDGSREESLARRVSAALDALREEFDMALICEHHSPHATGGQRRDLRPIGSSLWRRWPEFGIGLAPAQGSTRSDRIADVVHWRGGRDDRPWPEQLRSGGNGIPWVVENAHEYLARVS